MVSSIYNAFSQASSLLKEMVFTTKKDTPVLLESLYVPNFDFIESWIIKATDDPEKSKVMCEVLNEELAPNTEGMPKLFAAWTNFCTYEFLEWYCHMAKFLGSHGIIPFEFALNSFPPSLRAEFCKQEAYEVRKSALTKLLGNLQKAWGEKQALMGLTPRQLRKGHKIVLITRNCGFAHISCAQGIEDLLKEKGYTVYQVKMTEEAERRCNYTMTKIRRQVKSFNPSLIINTVAHHTRWTQLSYDLNVPSLVVSINYEVDRRVFESSILSKSGETITYPYKLDNSALVQYCIPHQHMDPTREKIKFSLTKARYDALIKEIGFPIRKPFVRETDLAKIDELRKEIDLKDNERIVLMMGHNQDEFNIMLDNIRMLCSDSNNFAAPFKIIAVCGSQKQAFESTLDKMKLHPQIRIKAEELLTADQLAKYMKVISRVSGKPGLMISKQGGSTMAEAIEMGVFEIQLPLRKEEAANGKHQCDHGLGVVYNKDHFVQQVNEAMKWDGDRRQVYQSPLDWKVNLANWVQEKLKDVQLVLDCKADWKTMNTL